MTRRWWRWVTRRNSREQDRADRALREARQHRREADMRWPEVHRARDLLSSPGGGY